MQHSTGYIVGFAAAVCLVASLFVAGSAVGLKDRQERNKVLDVQKKVLAVSNLMQEGASLTDEEVTARFYADYARHRSRLGSNACEHEKVQHVGLVGLYGNCH